MKQNPDAVGSLLRPPAISPAVRNCLCEVANTRTKLSLADDPAYDAARAEGTSEVLPDLAYRRLAIVNVVFIVHAARHDRDWVLIDAGAHGHEIADLVSGGRTAQAGEKVQSCRPVPADPR